MDPTTYRTVAAPVVASIDEKRSVFECWLRRVEDEPAARAVVEEARTTHWGAGHHCSAFVLGPAGATVDPPGGQSGGPSGGRAPRLMRSNDDGEPAGTAGSPMLEVLTGAGLTDVVAVVTRWFGGTLLGTGGLVRAYSGAVRAALGEATVLTRILVTEVDVRVGHGLAGRLENGLRARGVGIADVRYAAHVTLRLQVPAGDADGLPGLLAELSSGQAEAVPGSEGKGWVDLPPRATSGGGG